MGDILCVNNKLSFLKSVTTLIVPFFLGIANVGVLGSTFRGIVFFKDSNFHQSYNFFLHCDSCSTDLGTKYACTWTVLQLGSISRRLICYPMLNFPNDPSKRCSYFLSNILSWCCSITWRFSHVMMTSSKLAETCLYSASRILVAQEYSYLSVCGSFALK
jgi:hypothetical protein